ncbi:MAG: hypothetical protein J6F30_14075 [Cellulosilyticum sp.]|nr:hypothetical protein [Cellulosilyticum sp.]
MKLVCPNNHEHKRFSVIAHVTQEWAVTNDGFYDETLENCVDILAQPNADVFVFTCLTCGEEAITKGEIVEVFATIANGNVPYIDIYDKEDDARNMIDTIQDNKEIIGYIKGYCLRPIKHKYIYEDSANFYYSVEEAIDAAKSLGIDLKYLSPVKR